MDSLVEGAAPGTGQRHGREDIKGSVKGFLRHFYAGAELTEGSKPGLMRSRPSGYFQSSRLRAAFAA